MIKTHNLTKKYGESFAIQAIELDLAAGDLFGFIGPNGAGKTTTMKILATLLDELELSPEDLYEGDGLTAFSDLFQLYAALDLPRLKDPPLPPQQVPAFESALDEPNTSTKPVTAKNRNTFTDGT